MRANRYHRSPTRYSTIRCSKRRMPSLPSVIPVMMNPDKVGPRRIAAALSKPDAAPLSSNGSRPTPSLESTHELQTIHEKV